jgi:hypothetical protein
LTNHRWSVAILLAAGCIALVLSVVVGELTRVSGRCMEDTFLGIGAVPLALLASAFGVTALLGHRGEYRARRQRRQASTTWSPGAPASTDVAERPLAHMLLTTIVSILMSAAGLLFAAVILWSRMWVNFCF